MGSLSTVIEAVCISAGFAAEGEKVELVAVGVLAVCADGFEVGVADHAGESGRV